MDLWHLRKLRAVVMHRWRLLIVAFLACGMLNGTVACREEGKGGTPSSALPDPIVQRVGEKRARELHVGGVRRHIADVRQAFGYLIDVRAQCDVAETLIANEHDMSHQRPLLLCVGSLGDENPQLMINGINPHRETAGISFHCHLDGTPFSIRWDRPIETKDEEMTLSLPSLRIRFVTVEELRRRADPMSGNEHVLVVNDIESNDGFPVILLPEDIPVFVSVWDRSGLKSDIVPFHRNLLANPDITFSSQGNSAR